MSVVKILKSFRNVAVVGVSANGDKPSNVVFRYLMVQGYNVIPVNPTIDEVLGKKCYASLSAIPEKIDVVDISADPKIFRRLWMKRSKLGRKLSGCKKVLSINPLPKS